MYEKWKNEMCWNYPKKGEGEIKENDRGGKFNKIYCKHLCKCHNVPQFNTNMIIKSKNKNMKQNNFSWTKKRKRKNIKINKY
jgi:hypothetical protein